MKGVFNSTMLYSSRCCKRLNQGVVGWTCSLGREDQERGERIYVVTDLGNEVD